MFTQSFMVLACLELPEKFAVVVEGNFSVLLWSKTGILSLNSELDQAEQQWKQPGFSLPTWSIQCLGRTNYLGPHGFFRSHMVLTLSWTISSAVLSSVDSF